LAELLTKPHPTRTAALISLARFPPSVAPPLLERAVAALDFCKLAAARIEWKNPYALKPVIAMCPHNEKNGKRLYTGCMVAKNSSQEKMVRGLSIISSWSAKWAG
jgi:hypothetical protein